VAKPTVRYERAMPWRWVILRGTRVLARCAESGELSAEGGRVEIRYRAQDGKAYRAALGNLMPVAGEAVLPDSHCVDVASEGAASSAASRKKSPAKSVAAAPPPVDPHDPTTETIIAYTDGACSGNPGPAGLGVVLCQGHSRRELSEYLGHGTNNIAELTAILRALEALGHSAEHVSVYTDSQYAIGVLQKGWKPKVNQELIATTKRRMQGFSKLRLVYVKGHAGIPMNERADALARQAVSERDTQGWREVDGHVDTSG